MAESTKRYVKRPGGVLFQLADGTSEYRAYGAAVQKDELSEAQQAHWEAHTDSKKKSETPDDPGGVVALANASAARADGGQVNSTSSPIPGNYHELSEDEAVNLVNVTDQYPGIQAAFYIHEKANLGREKVLDAVRDEAKEMAEAQLKQVKAQLEAEHQVLTRDDSSREGGPTEVHTVVQPDEDVTVEAPDVASPPQTPPPSS